MTSVLRRLDGERAAVAHFWSVEVANALLMSEKRGRLSPERTSEAITAVNALNVAHEPVPDASRLNEIIELARSERLTVYDASYLAIAIRLRIAIASLDSDLCAAARRRALTVIGG